MNVAVIGAGGVGGFFGGKLAYAGNNVTFIARGKHMEAIQHNGLSVKSILGDFYIKEVNVTSEILSIKEPDLVLVAVKAWQVTEVAHQLKKVINNNTLVIPLQNGVKAAGELISELGKENVLGGLCFILSKIESPGVINHFGADPSITFGELTNEKTARALKLHEKLVEAGINAFLSDDIHAALWRKLTGICISALLAVTHCTYGQLREVPETRQMAYDLMKEIYLVSKKEGIDLPEDLVDKLMQAIDTFPFDAVSSLTRDVWEGRPSEIFYQNGTVAELAEKHNIQVPVNRFVFNCILPRELQIRKKM